MCYFFPEIGARFLKIQATHRNHLPKSPCLHILKGKRNQTTGFTAALLPDAGQKKTDWWRQMLKRYSKCFMQPPITARQEQGGNNIIFFGIGGGHTMGHFLTRFGSASSLTFTCCLQMYKAKWDELFCFEWHRFHSGVPSVATRVPPCDQATVLCSTIYRNDKFIKTEKSILTLWSCSSSHRGNKSHNPHQTHI